MVNVLCTGESSIAYAKHSRLERENKRRGWRQQQLHPLKSWAFDGMGRAFDGLGRAFDGLGRAFDGLGRAFDGLGRAFDGLGQAFDGLGHLMD